MTNYEWEKHLGRDDQEVLKKARDYMAAIADDRLWPQDVVDPIVLCDEFEESMMRFAQLIEAHEKLKNKVAAVRRALM